MRPTVRIARAAMERISALQRKQSIFEGGGLEVLGGPGVLEGGLSSDHAGRFHELKSAVRELSKCG